MSVLKPVITRAPPAAETRVYNASRHPERRRALVLLDKRTQIGDLLPDASLIVGMCGQGQITLKALHGEIVNVHLHRQRGASAQLLRVALVEDQQPVDRCRGAGKVVTRQVRRLQLRELARENLASRERPEVMLPQLHPAAVDAVENLLQLRRRQHASSVERIDDDVAKRAAELHEKAPRK